MAASGDGRNGGGTNDDGKGGKCGAKVQVCGEDNAALGKGGNIGTVGVLAIALIIAPGSSAVVVAVAFVPFVSLLFMPLPMTFPFVVLPSRNMAAAAAAIDDGDGLAAAAAASPNNEAAAVALDVNNG